MFIIRDGHLTTDNITICGNNVGAYDGAAFAAYGDLTINEGTEICHHYNTHTTGSAIYAYGGTVTMNGGIIEDNSVQSYGTIYLANYSDFILNGGIIWNNERYGTTQYGGGAIYVREATLTVNGGTITGHDVGSGYGGGIYCTSYGSVYLNGGVITGNNAYRGSDIFYSSQQGSDAQIHIGGEPKVGEMYLDNYYIDKYPYITSIIKNDMTLVVSTLEEGRILAVGADDYTLTEADAQKITVMDTSGAKYFVKLDETANSFVLTKDDPGYAQKYYISYYANGGTGQTIDDTPYILNETAEISSCDFEREGYEFIGWNTEADGTGESYNAGDKISVTADLPLFAQWKKIETFSIGDTKYTTLQSAVDNAQDGDVIVLSGNKEGDGIVIPSGKNIIIDLGGYTYTVSGELVGSAGTQTLGFQILKDSNITIKNGTLTENNPDMKMFVQNYSNLTLEDVTLDCEDNDKIQYVLSNNNGDINLIGDTNIKANDASVAFDVYDYASMGYTGVTVSVNTTGIIEGKIEVSEGNATLAISGGTFTTPLENEWCEKGFVPVENSDGRYTVIKREIVIADDTVSVIGLNENAVLILASYNNDRMIDIKLINVSADFDISISETGLVTADSVKAMLVKDLLTLTPMCEATIK